MVGAAYKHNIGFLIIHFTGIGGKMAELGHALCVLVSPISEIQQMNSGSCQYFAKFAYFNRQTYLSSTCLT